MSAGSSRISALTKELYVQWQQTKSYWNDAKTREFEQKYLQELFSTVEKTVTVIDDLEKLLGKIRKDCE